MKHQHLTWYVLADGTQADPNDVAPGEDGVLRHKNGMAVATHEDGTPLSVGVAAAEGGNVAAAEAGAAAAEQVRAETKVDPVAAADAAAPAPAPVAEPAPVAKPKEMAPEKPKPGKAKPGYKTRESKAR